jgi:hypothetical protein
MRYQSLKTYSSWRRSRSVVDDMLYGITQQVCALKFIQDTPLTSASRALSQLSNRAGFVNDMTTAIATL